MKNNELAHETDYMLHQAKRSIDALFGDGYAEKHPSLVGNFMIAMSNNAYFGDCDRSFRFIPIT
ncbi:hypothetical protein BOO22_08715 [Vibrio cidicii]|uniref:hypothetical protein n=1 Tax=Vibrio cidicii TaxID=1763883 RepID=UPI0018C236B1|nr:hypothetical protein [Vibrio cidicii]MBG0759498.1 hypothetical protein [Vibrio cidicii]